MTEKETAAPLELVHAAEMSLGQWIEGAVWSTTVTRKQHGDEFRSSSVAVQQTCVAPNENVEPDDGTQETVRLASQLSVADALKVTAAPFGLVHSAVMSPGQEMFGAWQSATVTVN